MITVEAWNRWYAFRHEGDVHSAVPHDKLKRDYKCALCQRTLVQYPPGRHEVDEWHVACAKCGNTRVFIHEYEVAKNKHEIYELIDALDPETQGSTIAILQQML